MRNGRGFDHDHDHESVEFNIRIPKRRNVKPVALAKTPITVSEQRCAGPCGKLYSTKRVDRDPGDGRPRFAFAKCNTLESGVQPVCVFCRADWECRAGILSRARSIVEGLPGDAALWIKECGGVAEGLGALWKDQGGTDRRVPFCHSCGCPIDRWKRKDARGGSGYHLDQTTPSGGYIPGNVRWYCTPCNIEKNDVKGFV